MTFVYKSSALTLVERPTERPATASFGRLDASAGRRFVSYLEIGGCNREFRGCNRRSGGQQPRFERQLPSEREKIAAGNRGDVREPRAAIVGRRSKGCGFSRLSTHKEKCYIKNTFGEILRQES